LVLALLANLGSHHKWTELLLNDTNLVSTICSKIPTSDDAPIILEATRMIRTVALWCRDESNGELWSKAKSYGKIILNSLVNNNAISALAFVIENTMEEDLLVVSSEAMRHIYWMSEKWENSARDESILSKEKLNKLSQSGELGLIFKNPINPNPVSKQESQDMTLEQTLVDCSATLLSFIESQIKIYQQSGYQRSTLLELLELGQDILNCTYSYSTLTPQASAGLAVALINFIENRSKNEVEMVKDDQQLEISHDDLVFSSMLLLDRAMEMSKSGSKDSIANLSSLLCNSPIVSTAILQRLLPRWVGWRLLNTLVCATVVERLIPGGRSADSVVEVLSENLDALLKGVEIETTEMVSEDAVRGLVLETAFFLGGILEPLSNENQRIDITPLRELLQDLWSQSPIKTDLEVEMDGDKVEVENYGDDEDDIIVVD